MKIINSFSDGTVSETTGSLKEGMIETVFQKGDEYTGYVLTTYRIDRVSPFGGLGKTVSTYAVKGRYSEKDHPPVRAFPPKRGFGGEISEYLTDRFNAQHNGAVREILSGNGLAGLDFATTVEYGVLDEVAPEFLELQESCPEKMRILYKERVVQ